MSKRKMARNRNNTPRRKRMSRASRLQSAAQWIKTYTGKDIGKGYSKWYGQDEVCAIIELRMFGVNISENRLNKAKEKVANKVKTRKLKERKKQREFKDLYSDSDDNFYYIAGYTPGGMPYGITWKEMSEELPWIED